LGFIGGDYFRSQDASHTRNTPVHTTLNKKDSQPVCFASGHTNGHSVQTSTQPSPGYTSFY